MGQNPYTITFGKEPNQLIPRAIQETQLIDVFSSESPSYQVCMVTGPRGCGKTVFMTEVARKLNQKGGWIVANLNPERDMLESLASKLGSENTLANAFKKAKINLSFLGFGVEVSGVAPITDVETALEKMLDTINRQGKRLLVTVDEATSTPSMRTFSAAFQILLRANLPIFLVMTGLHENIRELQDEKALTFLYRSPKIALDPLNLGTVQRNYQRNLPVDAETARSMARLTRGYSFAFQVLGYLVWEHGAMTDQVTDEFRQHLDDYVYDKVWSELSPGDRRVAYGIAQAPSGIVADVRGALDMTTNQFNPYRKRLIQKGIVDGSERGRVKFVLPCFEDYVLENYD